MKIAYLVVGFLIGGIISFALTNSFYQTNSRAYSGELRQPKPDATLIEPKWNWSDSTDAVKAAPQSHKIVYEDSTVRILRVVLESNKMEPIHTHQFKSVMWFTQATPMTYYRYGLTNNNYVIQDSIEIPKMPLEVLNRGDVVDAEGPHAIKNLSKEEGIAYRVEFKKKLKP